jgi:hypothetical protein
MPIQKPIQNAMQNVPQITFQFIGFSLYTERVAIKGDRMVFSYVKARLLQEDFQRAMQQQKR